MACELPVASGVPLSRWSSAELAREAIGRGAFSGLAHELQRRYSARNDGDEATEATEATDADA